MRASAMRTAVLASIVATAAVAGTARLGAQNPLPDMSRQQSVAIGRITLTAGRSTVLSTDFNVTRLAVTNPAIADAVVVTPREVLIDGKAPGTISLILWGTDRRTQYDVVVDQPVTALQQQLQELFPGENIHVTVNDEATTLSGRVSSNAVMMKAGEIAAKTSSKNKVINLLDVPGGIESQQVLLQVRFAEVNRQALTEVGVSLFTSPSGAGDWVGRSSTQQFAAPGFQTTVGPPGPGQPVGELTFSDFLNLFIFNWRHDVGALIKALQASGNLQSLAEPNLIAYNGKEASFLAGGEIPVPVITGTAAATGVSVLYKEFGIRLTFTPTIAGDTIRLKVKPEVSALDFANGVTISGFRIPALTTRRADTEVELRDGQSFAIAGLMNNVSQTDRQQIPLLGSLPIIGYLFKSKAERLSQTELMVLITPHLVRPLDPDEVPPLPTQPGRFMSSADGPGSRLQGGGGAMDAPSAPVDSDSRNR